ncbi:uncharacterized protein [Heptranchias perlo]|uniref:uncharacterized protein n=1 Tax=Heptranchias perlo TaxID=212740 RepID=UPI00355A10E0
MVGHLGTGTAYPSPTLSSHDVPSPSTCAHSLSGAPSPSPSLSPLSCAPSPPLPLPLSCVPSSPLPLSCISIIRSFLYNFRRFDGSF